MLKEGFHTIIFVKECKLASKFWVNQMEEEDLESENEDVVVQTTRKPGCSPKAANKSNKKLQRVKLPYFFWSVRGLANKKSIDILISLLKQHHPQLLFIVEPVTNFSYSLASIFENHNLFIVAHNQTSNNMAKLWCLLYTISLLNLNLLMFTTVCKEKFVILHVFIVPTLVLP